MALGCRKARCKWPWSLDTVKVKVGCQETLKGTCSVSPRGLGSAEEKGGGCHHCDHGACASSGTEDICKKIELSPGWHGLEAKQ